MLEELTSRHTVTSGKPGGRKVSLQCVLSQASQAAAQQAAQHSRYRQQEGVGSSLLHTGNCKQSQIM